MDEIINKYLQLDSTIAVIGATINPEKYGHKVFKFLKDRKFEVFPVNPKYSEILGVKTFPTVRYLPVRVNICDFVVRPSVGIEIVKSIKDLSYKPLIWLQPGAESDEIISFCNENGLPVVYGRCIMQETLRLQSKRSRNEFGMT